MPSFHRVTTRSRWLACSCHWSARSTSGPRTWSRRRWCRRNHKRRASGTAHSNEPEWPKLKIISNVTSSPKLFTKQWSRWRQGLVFAHLYFWCVRIFKLIGQRASFVPYLIRLGLSIQNVCHHLVIKLAQFKESVFPPSAGVRTRTHDLWSWNENATTRTRSPATVNEHWLDVSILGQSFVDVINLLLMLKIFF